MREIKIGAPGFILAKHLFNDFDGTVEKLSEIGFDGLEVTGFFGHSAEELREIFNKYGIEPFGCYALTPHMLCELLPEELGEWKAFETMMAMPGKTPDEVMSYIRAIGCRYIGLCMTPNEPDEKTLADIAKVSELANAHGMTLQYHNHNWEYINMTGGEYRMDRILRSIPDTVRFEPDLGWMGIGGYDCRKALRKYRDRIEIVHLKDYFRSGDALDREKDYRFRPTGYGVMDWANILAQCEADIRPQWYVADHDNAYDGDVFEELRLSLAYIRKMLSFIEK